jgi:hypothetical protein
MAIVFPVLVSRRWEILVILLGVELCSQSLHEKIHHPGSLFAEPFVRYLGILIALAGAWLL